MLQDIQQSDQAVDQLIRKLAVLLEQANGVLADIIQARSAERGDATTDGPPQDNPTAERGDATTDGPSQDDPAALQDDPTALQDDPAAPQDNPTAERGDATTEEPPQDNPTSERGDATTEGPPNDDHWGRGWEGGWWSEHSYGSAAPPAQCQWW